MTCPASTIHNHPNDLFLWAAINQICSLMFQRIAALSIATRITLETTHGHLNELQAQSHSLTKTLLQQHIGSSKPNKSRSKWTGQTNICAELDKRMPPTDETVCRAQFCQTQDQMLHAQTLTRMDTFHKCLDCRRRTQRLRISLGHSLQLDYGRVGLCLSARAPLYRRRSLPKQMTALLSKRLNRLNSLA